jgi:hypothetical protein
MTLARHFSCHCHPTSLSRSVVTVRLSSGSLSLPTTHRLMDTQVAAQKKIIKLSFQSRDIHINSSRVLDERIGHKGIPIAAYSTWK